MRVDIRKLEKRAVTIARGGPVSRAAANTIGRVLGFPNLIFTRKALSDPAVTPERRKQVRETAELLEGVTGDALSNTHIRLGGTDLIDDVLWRKELPGEDLPWTKQIGGRVWQNPRTSILGKVLGTALVPWSDLVTPLTRISHYNPYTDTVVKFDAEPAVTEHELGHAIDFNTTAAQSGGIPQGWWRRQTSGLLRDLRGVRAMGTQLLGLPALDIEMLANTHSGDALRRALKDRPEELRKRLKRRMQVLPSAYGSYIGMLAGPAGALAAGPSGQAVGQMLGPLTGAILGKGLGMTAAAMSSEDDWKADPVKKKDQESAGKERKERKASRREGRPQLAPA